ncbi:SGNH/GDSL hydrolase family protein [Mucilaginibacter sp. CSA2-8R]|uniref:SGNH/GDSL hydrolase family protein n=1 Tax=Mucilaginibacter sp. CSA2-8R TaxID=3141542 RepID=UPI00315D7684
MKTLLLLLIAAGFLFLSFSEKKVTWVAIGDSITYLNDHTNETGNRVTKGYLTRVVERLPQLAYVNQGHNGWTVVRIAQQIEKLGLVKADIYSVFLGTNDWWHSEPLGTFTNYKNATGNQTVYGAYRTIINKIHSLNPDAKIILITPLQRSDFVYINNSKNNAYGSYKAKDGQQLTDFAKAVDSIAHYEKCELVDLYHKSKITQKNLINFKRLKDPATGQYKNYKYPDFTQIPFNPETDEYPYPPEAIGMAYDGLHPSDKGNQRIADMIVKAMKKIMSK